MVQPLSLFPFLCFFVVPMTTSFVPTPTKRPVPLAAPMADNSDNNDADASSASPQLSLDHIVYVVPSLEAAMDDLEAQTGIRPVVGGRHLTLGTHNAFLGIGDGAYVELFAPDPDATVPVQPIIGVDTATTDSRISTYCCNAGAVGLATLVDQLQANDDTSSYFATTTETGSRVNAGDGTTVSWTIAVEKHAVVSDALPLRGLVPFFIDWGASAAQRPGVTVAPQGCTRTSFEAYHPQPDLLQKILADAGVGPNIVSAVRYGETPRLVLTLDTPRGTVTLS